MVPADALAFGPNGLIYIGSRNGYVLIYDPVTKKYVGEFKSKPAWNSVVPADALAFKTIKTGKESLVSIKLTLRSEKEYGSNNRKYLKKEKAEQYQIGNYDFEFNDKYKHDVFATTVLVRNLTW